MQTQYLICLLVIQPLPPLCRDYECLSPYLAFLFFLLSLSVAKPKGWEKQALNQPIPQPALFLSKQLSPAG